MSSDLGLGFLLLGMLACLPCLEGVPAAPTYSEAVIEGARGTKAFVTLQGGNIRMFRKLTKPGNSVSVATGEININFCEIRELNSKFEQSVDGQNKTRVISNMADQMFKCVGDYNHTIPHSSNVTADCLICETVLQAFNPPTLFVLNPCMIKDNGTVTQMDEISTLTIGQLKFSVEFRNGWPFCNQSCKYGDGQFLDLDICIRLPPGPARGVKTPAIQMENRPKRFNLGAGSMVEFSTKVELDRNFTTMAADFPKLSQRGGISVITLRLPKFTNTLVYDPLIETGDTVYVSCAGILIAEKFLILASIWFAKFGF